MSPGCAHCYAEAFDRRVGGKHWAKDAPRRFFGLKHWQEPLKWDAAAEKAGERHRVFCASMADVFEDRPDLIEERQRLWDLICRTHHLDWLLLTKRPENIERLLDLVRGPLGLTGLEQMQRGPMPNVWLGTTVEDQNWAERRIPILTKIPAIVRFLSMEPLLESVDLSLYLGLKTPLEYSGRGRCLGRGLLPDPVGIDWVIVGGESGSKRSFDAKWARSLVIQCNEASVPCFVKQMGSNPIGHDGLPWKLKDSHGGDWDEWPEHLRIREFPRAAEVAR